MLVVGERLVGPAAGRLQEVVRAALGEPAAVLGGWDVAPLDGGFGGIAERRWLYLLTGAARVGEAEHPWRVVLKVLASVAGPNDPTHIHYEKRERLLYDSGLLDALPAGLRAPRSFGCDELVDGTARRAAILETHSRTWDELAEARAATRPFLLARASEARGLMETF